MFVDGSFETETELEMIFWGIGYIYRWFWRAVFEIDGIYLGPARRTFTEYKLGAPIYEKTGKAGIPYVPLLKVRRQAPTSFTYTHDGYQCSYKLLLSSVASPSVDTIP